LFSSTYGAQAGRGYVPKKRDINEGLTKREKIRDLPERSSGNRRSPRCRRKEPSKTGRAKRTNREGKLAANLKINKGFLLREEGEGQKIKM